MKSQSCRPEMYLAALAFDNKHEKQWNVIFRINKLESQYGWVVKAQKLLCIRNSKICSLKIKRDNRGNITFSRITIHLFKCVYNPKQKWQKKIQIQMLDNQIKWHIFHYRQKKQVVASLQHTETNHSLWFQQKMRTEDCSCQWHSLILTR